MVSPIRRVTTNVPVVDEVSISNAAVPVGIGVPVPEPAIAEIETTVEVISPEEIPVQVTFWVESQFTTQKDRTMLGAFEQMMRARGKAAATPVEYERLFHEFSKES